MLCGVVGVGPRLHIFPMPDDFWLEPAELVWIPILAVFGASILLLYVWANPAAPWQAEAVVSTAFSVAGSGQVTANTTLVLPVEDAAYLNRAYRDLNTRTGDSVGEQGYCIDVVNGRMSVQQAGTLKASESSVTFTTANCFLGSVSDSPKGILHFHPLGSDPELSGPDTSVHPEMNDKSTLLSSGFVFSCVQAGIIPEEPGADPAALKCYMKPASGDIDDVFPEVPVVIR